MPFLSEFAVAIGIGIETFLKLPTANWRLPTDSLSIPKPDTDPDSRLSSCARHLTLFRGTLI